MVAACGDEDSASAGGSGGGEVALVAYSTPQTLYEDTIEPAFQETSKGADIEFSNSFGASGDQSRAVEAGQPADLVHLSIEPDMARLVDAGLVAEDWADNEYGGILQNSVVVFTVRAGNPEGIETWEDVASGEHEVITPNPFTSGGARWNIMAAYGSQIEQGASEEEALAFVQSILEAAPVQPKSAADALEVFLGGEGDVLISYENEAIRAQGEEDVEYVVPDETILIETPAAVTTEAGENPEGAQAFLDYLYSDEGQQLFADGGYRPVVESVLEENEDKFPTPPSLFTIDDLGGWETITTEFFDPESGSIAEIERNLGVTTG
jgi:sulfate transport system substrate-binding protein